MSSYKSPGNTYAELREKARYYLAHGSRMVWLVYPEKREIEVHTTEVIPLQATDTLTGGEVLPGFSAPVADIFDLG